MQNLALTWQQSAEVALVLAGVGITLRLAPPSRVRRLIPVTVESCLIAALYALWQYAGELSVVGTSGAFARARWIERVEGRWHLPAERDVQGLVLGHPTLVQGANLYYAAMHFGALFVFLIWMFVWHRDRYGYVRTVLVLSTFACLLIQLLPVAPPRLLPGFVDTASQYGQSVYAFGLAPDELSAMPSVHVAWAVLIGWYAARVGHSGWRWLGAGHAALTLFVVVCTANHWWADGIVGVAVLAACAWLVRGAYAVWHAGRRAGADGETGAGVAGAGSAGADESRDAGSLRSSV